MARKIKVVTMLGATPAFSPEAYDVLNLNEDMFDSGYSQCEAYVEDMNGRYAREAAEAIQLLLESGWTEAELEELSLCDIRMIARGTMQ